jgi:hypothetical protein
VPWSHLRLPALIVAGAVLVLGAPLLGWALGDRDEASGSATARSQSLQVSYAPPWQPSGVAIRGLGIDGAVGLRRPGGVVLAAGRLRDPSPGLDPAPQALRDVSARRLQPARVRLGDREAIRYAVPLRAGGSLWMVAFPDSRGWTAVACTAPAGRPDGACASVAATLRSRSGKPIALGADNRVAQAVARAIRRLNRARVAARPKIRSRSTATRAGAFGALARADLMAAASLARLKLRAQEPAPVEAAVTALRAEAKVLRKLEGATRARRRTTYNRLRGSLGLAQRRIATAVRHL